MATWEQRQAAIQRASAKVRSGNEFLRRNGCTCPDEPHRVRAHCPVHGWTALAAMERQLADVEESRR